MQKSVEVEYWVVDRDGSLAPPGDLAEVSDLTEEEFVRPLFELKTPPCETCEELHETFLDQLARVLSRAEELDKLLVPLGTPVNGERIERWPDERGRIQRRALGVDFAYAKYCAGTHVHFEKRNVVDQLNALVGLDPAMALLSSSPYFRGEPVADGARAYLYREACYADLPRHGQLWDYVETVAEWERRLDRRYEEFEAAAVDAGVDREAVAEHFSADDAVWTPVRLRDEMPTVEWRAPDAALPSQTLRLVEDLDRVMERLHHTNVTVGGDRAGATDDGLVLPEYETLRDLVDDAIRDGLRSTDVVDYLDRMGFGVDGYDPGTRALAGRGRVDPDEARDLRVRWGKRLRRDVAALRDSA